MDLTHIVIKLEDIGKYLTPLQKETLYSALSEISTRRRGDGKDDNKYHICNLDEPYADKVLEVILVGEEQKTEVSDRTDEPEAGLEQTPEPAEELEPETLIVTRTFYFDVAHHLPHYDGVCARLHGHRLRLEVAVSGFPIENGPKTGMVIDFGDIDSIVEERVGKWVDHNELNNLIENPTAENLIVWIWNRLRGEFGKGIYGGRDLRLIGLKLWETPDSCVTMVGGEI